MAPLLPPILENSHDDGSHAAIQILLLSFCMWETLYRISGLMIKKLLLIRYPNQNQRVDSSSSSSPLLMKSKENGNTYDDDRCQYSSNNNNGSSSHNNTTTTNPNKYKLDPTGSAQQQQQLRHTLLHRGPSYLVSFLHSIYATCRGCVHLYQLWNASYIDKLLIPSTAKITTPTIATSTILSNNYRGAHLNVAQTNIVFLSYLLYDLCHILHQYPKLGGLDTVLHHVLFASCSLINGTFGLMAFCFGWLVVGEGSTIFLNIRWYLLKSETSGETTKTTKGQSGMINMINGLFALTFFITRIGIYSAGMIHLFYYSWDELISLPMECGVPWTMLGLTCGCMILGWVLNFIWGYKILSMVVGGSRGGDDQSSAKDEKNE